MTDAELLVTCIVELYHAVHNELRKEIGALSDEALNWPPGSEMNSIATLVVHLLASEAEMLQSVRGFPAPRERDAEFAQRRYARDELLDRLSAADAELDQSGGGITATDLQAERSRPNKPAPATGMFWLLRNYGHAREHLAHIQLTRQVFSLQR